MKLEISPQEWKDAKAYFASHKSEVKMKKANPLVHSFVKIGKIIYALARKKHPNEGILGRGGQGIVKLGQSKTGIQAAIKIEGVYQLKKGTHWTKDSLQIMKKINFLKGHVKRPLGKKITYFKQQIETKSYTALKYIDGLALDEYLTKHPFSHDAASRLTEYLIALRCTMALLKLHQLRIIHGDVKPQNVVLYNNLYNNVRAEFIDFNFSLWLPEGSNHRMETSAPGTFGYAAPEICTKRCYSFESDIFALGKMFQTRFPHLATLSKEMCERLPQNRVSLQETLIFILHKIYRLNLKLDPGPLFIIEQAMSMIMPYLEEHLKKELPLSILLTFSLSERLLTKEQRFIIGLKCAHAVLFNQSQNLLGRNDISPLNFNVQCVDNTITVEFDSNFRHNMNDAEEVTYLSHFFSTDFDSSQRCSLSENVYSLGKIFQQLGFSAPAMLSDIRPSLAQAILDLITQNELVLSEQSTNTVNQIRTDCQILIELNQSLEPSSFYSDPNSSEEDFGLDNLPLTCLTTRPKLLSFSYFFDEVSTPLADIPFTEPRDLCFNSNPSLK